MRGTHDGTFMCLIECQLEEHRLREAESKKDKRSLKLELKEVCGCAQACVHPCHDLLSSALSCGGTNALLPKDRASLGPAAADLRRVSSRRVHLDSSN